MYRRNFYKAGLTFWLIKKCPIVKRWSRWLRSQLLIFCIKRECFMILSGMPKKKMKMMMGKDRRVKV